MIFRSTEPKPRTRKSVDLLVKLYTLYSDFANNLVFGLQKPCILQKCNLVAGIAFDYCSEMMSMSNKNLM